jgi:NAD(P)H-hydrate epimerase
MFNLQKILSAQQTRKADEFTIQKEPIASIDLMERASLAFVDEFLQHEESTTKIAVICGTGNNGGDGFAITRLLKAEGFEVTAFLIRFREELSPDCQSNFDQLQNVVTVRPSDTLPNFSSFDVVIDAIFGTGLKRPAEGLVAKVIAKINVSNAKVYSVDLPSGLFSDELTYSEYIVQSDVTISFQRPKKAFFFPENTDFIKAWKVVDIGLNENFIQQQDTSDFVLDKQISAQLKPRKRYSHKGTYGHALIISGSYGKIGATVLTSKACLRSGAGLVTTYLPKCGYEILQTSVPEAMCLTDENSAFISTLPNLEKYGAVGVGPGLGTHTTTAKVICELLQNVKVPLLLDADALNIISQNTQWLKLIPEGTILTPDIKEFDRLFGTSATSEERYKKQREFSIQQKVIIVLKDAHTCISDSQGNLYFNTSGNPGMATGGSGDVLTGMITGLLAQNYDSIQAALLGVYYHGLAGDTAAKEKGQYSMIASDIVESLKLSSVF